MQYKKKIFIITIPYFLIIIILSLFLLWPSITEIKNISQEIKDKKQTLLKKQSSGQNIQKNIDELNRVKKSAAVSSAFAESEDKLGFIKNLELIAKKYYVDQDIKISEQGEDDEAKLKITINSEGKFIDLNRYLYSLETQEYYLNINSISINSSGVNLAEDSVKNMKLSISAYVYLR